MTSRAHTERSSRSQSDDAVRGRIRGLVLRWTGTSRPSRGRIYCALKSGLVAARTREDREALAAALDLLCGIADEGVIPHG